jgi:hypothetical protein
MNSSPRARLEASLLLDSLTVHRPKRVNSSHGVTKGAEGRSAPRLASSKRPDGAGRLMNGSFLAERHSAHRPLFSSFGSPDSVVWSRRIIGDPSRKT